MKQIILAILVLTTASCCPETGSNDVMKPTDPTPVQPTPGHDGKDKPDSLQIDTTIVDPINPDPVEDSVIRILAIGNSFSEDAVEQELYPLFKAVGQKVIIGDMFIAGCSLEKHWQMASGNSPYYSYRKIVNGETKRKENRVLSYALKDEEWDYISVQEGAGHHGMKDYIEPALTNLIGYLRENSANPDFKLIYHVPWCADSSSTATNFGFYNYDQAYMYQCIVETTKWVMENHPEIDIMINSFDALQNARTTYIGDNFNRDGWHVTMDCGRYVLGCLWFEKIMGISVVGNPYRHYAITPYATEALQTAAHEAALHPYETIDLSERYPAPTTK